MDNAERVKGLRKKRNLSQKEFAELTGFSHSYIQKFEEGNRPLNTSHLIRFSKVLNVNPFDIIRTDNTNFDNSSSLSFELNKIEYRNKNDIFNAINLEKDIIDSISEYFYSIIELENILGDKVKFNNPLKDFKISEENDVEEAVKILRKKWKLGQSPIYDVVYLLERKGIKVFEVEKEYDFAGFSGWAGDVPLIVLNIVNPDIARRRFTALHELAHIVLSFDIDDQERIERLCNSFAGAMLLAEDIIKDTFRNNSNVTLEELKTIKKVFGISIQAIMLRAKSLNYIDWGTYMEWREQYRIWVENEDLDFGTYNSYEKPTRFTELLSKGINGEDQILSLAKASTLSGLTTSEIKEKFGNKNFLIN